MRKSKREQGRRIDGKARKECKICYVNTSIKIKMFKAFYNNNNNKYLRKRNKIKKNYCE